MTSIHLKKEDLFQHYSNTEIGLSYRLQVAAYGSTEAEIDCLVYKSHLWLDRGRCFIIGNKGLSHKPDFEQLVIGLLTEGTGWILAAKYLNQ